VLGASDVQADDGLGHISRNCTEGQK